MKRKYLLPLLVIVMAMFTLLYACESVGAQTEKLKTPQNVRIENDVLMWDTVENAVGYIVEFKEGYTVSALTNSLDLMILSSGRYNIRVKAVGDFIVYSNSDYSNAADYNVPEAPQGLEHILEGGNEIFKWNLVADAYSYEIMLGDNTYVTQSTMCAVSFLFPDTLNAGLHEVKVRALSETGRKNAWSKPVDYVKGSGGLSYREQGGVQYVSAGTATDLRIYIPKFHNGKTVDEIDDNGFANKDITNIYISDSIMAIGVNAFRQCNFLTSFTVPESVKIIGNYAFDGCESLASFTIHSGVTSLGLGFLRNCTSLISINTGTTSVPSYDCFYAINGEGGIVKENGTALIAKTNNVHSIVAVAGAATKLTIPSIVSEIGDFAATGCENLTKITIPQTVKRIGASAFMSCSSLSSLTIYNGVKEIGENSFYNCASLASVVIPKSTEGIGINAFGDCNSLESVNLPFTGFDGTTYTHFGYIFGASTYSDNFACVPASLKTVTLTGAYRVDDNAFLGCSNIKEINLPKTVIIIGENAFNSCSALVSMIVPDSVEEIGFGAFYSCSSLESVTLPFTGNTLNGVTGTHFGYVFGASTYSDNSACVPASLKTVTITGSERIDNNTFSGCEHLETVNIPDTIIEIGTEVFTGCILLVSLTLPFVGDELINPTHTNFGYFFGDNNYLNHSTSVPATLKNVTITGGEVLGDWAFYRCENIEILILPNRISTMGLSVFDGCESLVSVTIPFDVTNAEDISAAMFYGCTSLSSINTYSTALSLVNGLYVINADGVIVKENGIAVVIKINGVHVLNSVGGTALRLYIPSEVTQIGENAFYKCSLLKSVFVPDTIAEIDFGTFGDCVSLEFITLPFVGNTASGTTNTHFGYIFGANSYLENLLTVPTTLETVIITGGEKIYDNAFRNCASIEKIVLPSTVNEIGTNIFTDCISLKSLTVPFADGRLGSIASDVFFGYLFGGASHSDNADVIPTTLKEVIILGGDTIAENMFYFCASIETVILPDSLISIEARAFQDCALTEIIIPDSVESIGGAVFQGCSALTSVTIGSNVLSIGGFAFYGCSALSSIVIPDSVESIGVCAFQGCVSLASIIIGRGVINIENWAFSACNVTSITIPNSVITIGTWVFSSCSSLTSITIPDSVTSIGDWAFDSCPNLTIYVTVASDLAGWLSNWNASRPVIRNCVTDLDEVSGGKGNPYVVSFNKTADILETLNAPYRKGYAFEGWFTNMACTVGYVSAADIGTATNGIYYAKWTQIIPFVGKGDTPIDICTIVSYVGHAVSTGTVITLFPLCIKRNLPLV